MSMPHATCTVNMNMTRHTLNPSSAFSRRQMLSRCGVGFGALGLAGIMGDAGLLTPAPATAAELTHPLAPRFPQFPARAKRVVHFFLNGGPSQVDSFDPKPMLEKYAGKPMPGGNLPTERKTGGALPSPFKYQRYGKSGLEISDLFPKLGQCADDLCIIRSMRAEVPNHEPSLMLMNCGDQQLARPSMGAWITYGLGTENQNLPGFIAMCPGGYPIKDAENWGNAFLPGVYQGTYIDSKNTELDKLIENIRSKNMTSNGPSRCVRNSTCCNRSTPSTRRAQGSADSPPWKRVFNLSRTGLSDAERSRRRVRHQQGTGKHPRDVRRRRTWPPDADRPPAYWLGAGWRCASSNSGTARANLGTATPRSRRTTASCCMELDQPAAAPGSRTSSSAACSKTR